MWNALKNKILFLLFIGFILQPCILRAQPPLEMAFIVPGGEGTTEQAQSHLDLLFKLIQEKGGPQLSGAYYPNLSQGQQAIKTKKVSLGILSHDAALEISKKIAIKPYMATLPLQSKGAFETMVLVGTGKEVINPIYTERDFTPQYISTYLFKNIQDPQIQLAHSTIGTLRKLGNETLKGTFLLDNYQWTSIQKLKQAWSAKLKEVASSDKIPSARVVLFKDIPTEIKQNLKKALLQLGKTPQEKQLLNDLRLKGFSELS